MIDSSFKRTGVVLFSSFALMACSVGGTSGLPDGDIIGVDADPLRFRDAGTPPGIDGGELPEGCAPEACGNGLDDDCDGIVEEDCGCIPGETASCFAGRAEQRGLGACVDGTMECSDGLEFGHWGDCVGDVVPAAEACEVAEVDEDCDGAANEGCECTGSEPLPCGSDTGACGAGIQECNDGIRGACAGATGPVAEECNGIDDDCDGTIDETLTRVCGSEVGECVTGVQTCVDGEWDTCAGGRMPVDEICDGDDDDCDGMIDEALVRACGSTVGACMPGNQICSSGGWSICTGETVATLEECNDDDDDCDGMTDEALSRRCGSDLGLCSSGTQACASGDWGTCTGATVPGDEACDGLLDEDCDGMVDEGCDCVTGRTRSCGTDEGACVAGTETCSVTGAWGACSGATSGGDEACNDTDDDCDGRVDEGLVRGCGTDTGSCRAGTQTCTAGVWSVACAGSLGPSSELCDGVNDEDCDGILDNGCACTDGQTRACGSDTGECRAGSETCDVTGAWSSCSGDIGPVVETCNNRDDDCDDVVDNGLTRTCGSDIGICQTGVQTCGAGAWGTCAGETPAGTELCDAMALDEDCDGTVDEGCNCTNGTSRDCGTDTGQCAFGSQTCTGGMWEACTGGTGPTGETCDGFDEDCDGDIDEMLTQACGTNTGICVAGTETCSAGDWGSCAGEVTAGTEACDGSLDEDCDGLTDEGCDCVTGSTRECGTNRGECSTGTETCDAAGQWGACVGSVGPIDEICDDLNNDCDRAVDEDLTRSCGTDVGICMSGTETCSRGDWGTCAGGVTAGTELCDGSLDEDCDTSVDEGCACIDGQTRSCGTDQGACAFGTETCDLDGDWGMCQGGAGPVPETCNGIDDDCDVSVDEGTCIFTPPVAMCPSGMTAEVLDTVTLSASGSDPDGGSVTFQWTVISRPVGSTANPSSPTSATTNFFLDASGTFTLRFCVTDDEGEMACCDVTVISEPPGVLHVELSWEEGWGDVDLHLLNTARVPDDGWFTTDDCYWSNPTPDWGPLGGAANPTLDRDDRDGFGPENVTINTSPAAGVYDIGVHYFCDRSAGGTGPATATIRVYCMGALVDTFTGVDLSSTDDWNTVADVEWPSCRVRRVNDATNGSSILPPSFTQARHCEISCETDADCPDNERCVLVGGGGPPRLACILN